MRTPCLQSNADSDFTAACVNRTAQKQLRLYHMKIYLYRDKAYFLEHSFQISVPAIDIPARRLWKSIPCSNPHKKEGSTSVSQKCFPLFLMLSCFFKVPQPSGSGSLNFPSAPPALPCPSPAGCQDGPRCRNRPPRQKDTPHPALCRCRVYYSHWAYNTR